MQASCEITKVVSSRSVTPAHFRFASIVVARQRAREFHRPEDIVGMRGILVYEREMTFVLPFFFSKLKITQNTPYYPDPLRKDIERRAVEGKVRSFFIDHVDFSHLLRNRLSCQLVDQVC